MQDLTLWEEFWKGRVVLEKYPIVKDNPGHILGFVKYDHMTMINVKWANGDEYTVTPQEILFE